MMGRPKAPLVVVVGLACWCAPVRTFADTSIDAGSTDAAHRQESAAPPTSSSSASAGTSWHAQTPSATPTSSASAQTASSAPSPDLEQVWGSCIEHLPDGITPPKMEETLPERGLSGYAVPLRLVIHHGKGETVLPSGLGINSSSDAAQALRTAGFVLPAADGGAGPGISTRDDGATAVTEVVVSVVPLPPKPGRQTLTLPPLPIALSRASGELITLCTKPHRLVVEDPIANEPNATPKPNPDPRPQRELWKLARDASVAGLIGAAIALLGGWLLLRYLRRPRPLPPPPPPRPPWEVAMEELDTIRAAGLLTEGRFAEYVDRVSDTVRRFLGSVYRFDGIESTTDEVLAALDKASKSHGTAGGGLPAMDEVRRVLWDGDLVKFARMVPSAEDCTQFMSEAEVIVRATTPQASPASTPKEPSVPPEGLK